MSTFLSKFYYKILGDAGVYMQVYGKYEKSAKLCEKSVKNGGESIGALNLYSIIKLQEGNALEALEYLTKAKKLNKNPVVNKRLTISISSCYWLLGDIDKGIDIITPLMTEYDYVSPDVYTMLGFLYLIKKDYGNALKYSNEAIKIDENHAPAYDNLGQIFYVKEDLANAEINFLEALRLNPSMTDSKYYLGLINERNGDLQSAKAFFESAERDYVTALNTVTKEDITKKYEQYKSIETVYSNKPKEDVE